jgi:hypothetical protein
VDFARVLTLVIPFLESKDFDHALIGGLSMAAYGMPRTTVDLDLVVTSEAQDDLVEFLESQGYETLHRSTGYSNHLHNDPELGRVDVVYVRDATGRELFADVRRVAGPGGVDLPVLRPGHLVAMKVFAMKNDPSRTFREMADIRFLMTLPELERDEIRRCFEKHGLGHRYGELEESL